jgi:hypothetical protein
VDRAFREVPYYRDMWGEAGRALPEPRVSPAAELADQLFRLCPLARPWRAREEPSLWIGSPADLAAALSLATEERVHGPVLEVRPALVDWTALPPRRGPRYGVLLAPDATVGAVTTRLSLHVPALALAAAAGGAVVVGSPAQLAQVVPEVTQALAGRDLRLDGLPRLSLAAAAADPDVAPALLHDPYLGHVGARPRSCRRAHVDWRRYHCRRREPGVVVTRLRDRRPTLVDVLPVEPGFGGVGRCPEHGTPVLVD